MKFPAQILRHGVRFAVLLFIIAVPCLANYRILLQDNRIEAIRQQEENSLARAVILAIDHFHEDERREETLAALAKVRGNHWSADIGGLSLTDPLAAAESLAAGKRFHRALVLGALIPVVATLLLGRFFCSWICPAGFLFDLTDRLRAVLRRMRVRLHDTALWRGNKFVLLLAGLALAALTSIPLLGFFYPPALLGREIHGAVDSLFSNLADSPARAAALPLTAASLFLFFIVLVEVFFSRRAWCRYLCPGGALYTLLGSARLVRVKNDHPRCTQCTECIQVCPMALNPMSHDTPGPECDQCLLCLPACKPGSLSLELGLPKRHEGRTPSVKPESLKCEPLKSAVVPRSPNMESHHPSFAAPQAHRTTNRRLFRHLCSSVFHPCFIRAKHSLHLEFRHGFRRMEHGLARIFRCLIRNPHPNDCITSQALAVSAADTGGFHRPKETKT